MPWICVNCHEPIPTPTSDPFRCPPCRARANEPQDDATDLSDEQLERGDDFRQLLDMSDRRGLDWIHRIVVGIAEIQGRKLCR